MNGLDKIDAQGNLISAYMTSVGYNTAGQVTSAAPANGINETFGYSDDRLQLTAQNVTRQIGQQTTTLMGLTYGYTSIAGASGVGTNSGNSGQLMSITGTINSQTRDQAFTYDDMGRLATATGWGRWGRRFTYDRWGNRTKTEELLPPSVWCTKQVMDFKPGPSGSPLTNQVTSVEEYANCSRTSVSPNYYDAAGNTTSYGNNGWISYVYDGESRLVRFQGSLGQSLGEYSYDAGNRRVKRIASGITTHYVWEGGQVIAEYNGVTGVLICEYIHAGSRMLAREQSGVLRYYHQDRLSTRMITDSSGQVVGTQDHMPFGEDATGEESKEQEKHRFTSYERDSESKTDYAVNRQYGTATGRFMQPDPIQGSIVGPQSMNRYSYSLNDPINLSDPTGLNPYAWMTNAAIHGPGLYIDGIQVLEGQESLFWGLLSSGAGVVAPFGARAELRAGGSTWIVFPYLNGSTTGDVIRIGTVEMEVQNDDFQERIYFVVWKAREILEEDYKKGKLDCLSLLSGPNATIPDLIGYFGKLSSNGRIHPGRTDGGIAATRNAKPLPEITISTLFRSTFRVYGQGTAPGDIPLDPKKISPLEIQVLAILHELGHATEAPSHLNRDLGHRAEADYNRKIYQNCIKGRNLRE